MQLLWILMGNADRTLKLVENKLRRKNPELQAPCLSPASHQDPNSPNLMRNPQPFLTPEQPPPAGVEGLSAGAGCQGQRLGCRDAGGSVTKGSLILLGAPYFRL